jgi:hypothetical protein
VPEKRQHADRIAVHAERHQHHGVHADPLDELEVARLGTTAQLLEIRDRVRERRAGREHRGHVAMTFEGHRLHDQLARFGEHRGIAIRERRGHQRGAIVRQQQHAARIADQRRQPVHDGIEQRRQIRGGFEERARRFGDHANRIERRQATLARVSSNSRTLRASASGVTGFCRNASSSVKMP